MAAKQNKERSASRTYDLIIPNMEVRQIFVSQIQEWFKDFISKDRIRLSEFCRAFKEGKPENAEQMLNAYLQKTISIRDTFVKTKRENFYHGIFLGLLSSEEDWIIRSNPESGDDYTDILIEIEDERIGIIIEVKYSENDALEIDCKKALKQITDLQYTEKLQNDGMNKVFGYGIACFKKRCKVIYEQL